MILMYKVRATYYVLTSYVIGVLPQMAAAECVIGYGADCQSNTLVLYW